MGEGCVQEEKRGVWLNFGKREAACIRPTWSGREQWRIKQAIKKEEKEGSAATATKQGRSLLRRRIEPHHDDDDGREESKT